MRLNTVTLTGWKQSVAVFMDWHVAGLVFLGFSAGLPFLLVFSTMSAWLTDYSVSRTTIGFFSWIGILYSIKVVWAPVVDRVRLPLFCRLGQRRGWMLIAQIGIAFGLIGLALVDPSQDLQLIALLGLLVAFSSATQDVVIDAYRIEIADSEKQAALAGAYIFGYRLALLVAGAGALYLADFFFLECRLLCYGSHSGCWDRYDLCGSGTEKSSDRPSDRQGNGSSQFGCKSYSRCCGGSL